jgi:predicted metal-dependent phosphotriesterase family hydrolase
MTDLDGAGTVHTVRGAIDPASLGVTYVHEHMLCDAPPAMKATSGGEDLLLEDEDKSSAELELFKQAGGSAVIDLTCVEYGRDIEGLQRLSERTGIHIVAATGHIMEGYWTGVVDIASRSDTELVDEMVHDITEGLDGTSIRAGVIKVGSSKDKVTTDEERMIRAAVTAQRATGAPISTHTTAGTMGPAQAAIFTDAKADMDHVIIGHLDRNLDWEDHLAVAKSGARMGFDCISKEHYQPDSLRVEFIKRLADLGYADRLCFSGDLARRSYLTSYGGGPGMTYILWRFVPWLRQEGVSEEHIHGFLVDNPARQFTFTQ